METSILTGTKKILGLAPEYTVFDHDITTHINTALATLTQLGIGPLGGFRIDDADPVWADFVPEDDNEYNAVQTYVYLKVRMLFDPPTTSYQIDAAHNQLQEIEWRLSVHREDLEWIDPNPVVVSDDYEPTGFGL